MSDLIYHETRLVLDGQKFRRARLDKKLTIKKLAELSGYSCAFICDIEHGRRKAYEKTAKDLVESIGVLK